MTHPLQSQAETTADLRKLALANWLSLAIDNQVTQDQLNAISSDAGFRRYFRCAATPGKLVVDAPPASEDTAQFVRICQLLRRQELRTPQIFAADESQGFLLIEDFGDLLLNPALTPGNTSELYSLAMAELLKLQTCADDPQLIPRYDQALLRRELEIFSTWFLEPLLGYQLENSESTLLERVFGLLEQNSLAQPQCLVHRDFHSRNLLLCSDGQLGVIDFQGALWGAISYDLASLLRDCYKRLPIAQVDQLRDRYFHLAQSQGLLPGVDSLQFKRWFDWTGLQRHIKVLGIFARLWLRDGKPGYLQDLPLVIRYTLEVAEAYPELAEFADWFKARLLPLAEAQPWYSDYRVAGD